MTDLFDYIASLDAKEDGIKQIEATTEDWMARAFVKACQWCRAHRGEEIIGEDIRVALLDGGIATPHPNAWGALIRQLRTAGWLEPTLRMRRPIGVKSHSRPCTIYIVSPPE